MPGALRPVVYLPTWLQWDVMKQRPQYILEALSRAGHTVWFVDPRMSSVWEPSPTISIVPSLSAVPAANVIIYTHFAPTLTLLDKFEGPAVVYDILDDLSIYDPDEESLPSHRRVRHSHGPMVSRADIMTVSNAVLFDKHRAERPDLVLLENGVDVDVFKPDGVEARGLPEGPIVGYHGAISMWFDFDLVESVARSRPNLSFVLVGPVDDRVEKRAASLFDLANVHHFPRQTAHRVVEFVRGFDVGIVPFIVNEMTEGVTPLKMYEFMAMQVPCVSTPLPASLAHPRVAIAADARQVGSAIDSALGINEGERLELREEAMAASWDRRIEPLLARLDSDGLRLVPHP